jgi:hypothetical protein
MSVESGFNSLQTTVNVDADDLAEARRRRNVFCAELLKEDDILEVRPSGSLARGTHKDPVHDVDLVVVFDAAKHPDWNQPGRSADTALAHLQDAVRRRLESDGTGDVRLARPRDHSVKCFLDDPGDPSAFTVDVTPALVRVEGGIHIPESRSATWVASDPQYLIDRVAERHREWNEFARLVRVLKRWNTDHGGHMKSLTVEVLALTHLPVAARPNAVAAYFAATQEAVWDPIVDPAGLCGPIQPDLDAAPVSEQLAKAADLANRAVEAAANGEKQNAQCLWRQLFGDIFPEPYGGCGGIGAGAGAAAEAVPKRPVVDSPQG